MTRRNAITTDTAEKIARDQFERRLRAYEATEVVYQCNAYRDIDDDGRIYGTAITVEFDNHLGTKAGPKIVIRKLAYQTYDLDDVSDDLRQSVDRDTQMWRQTDYMAISSASFRKLVETVERYNDQEGDDDNER